jgi:hypothetical protein
MTSASPAPAPLEAHNGQRAKALKAKIGDRVSDSPPSGWSSPSFVVVAMRQTRGAISMR